MVGLISALWPFITTNLGGLGPRSIASDFVGLVARSAPSDLLGMRRLTEPLVNCAELSLFDATTGTLTDAEVFNGAAGARREPCKEEETVWCSRWREPGGWRQRSEFCSLLRRSQEKPLVAVCGERSGGCRCMPADCDGNASSDVPVLVGVGEAVVRKDVPVDVVPLGTT